jgi:hypothetical protein
MIIVRLAMMTMSGWMKVNKIGREAEKEVELDSRNEFRGYLRRGSTNLEVLNIKNPRTSLFSLTKYWYF